MNDAFEFLIFLGALLLVSGVWSIAISAGQIAEWLSKGHER